MKHKIVVLMCVPLVFFGISFKVISHPDANEKKEKIEDIKTELSAGKEPEKKENSFLLRQTYVLPVEQALAPSKRPGKENILIDAKAALVIDEYTGEVLYEKNSKEKVKIASLTKLATAGTMLDFIKTENSNLIIKVGNYNLDKEVEVTKTAVQAEGDSGNLLVGEKIKAGELLKIMLIASSNDAAHALAEDISKKNNLKEEGDDYFVGMMNDFVKKEGLTDTHFTNPDGIDERDNYSTAKDVVELAKNLFKEYPEIFGITKIDKINIKSSDGKTEHLVRSTNKLLGVLPGIVGGKTGYTDEAGESLLLVVEDSTHQHKIVAVVIGANGRFSEMQRLVNWVWDVYEWR